jgi:predicted lipoprotein with Yx(FWY)xxD motif
MKVQVTTLIAVAATFAIALVSTAYGSSVYSPGGYGAPIAASTRVAAATVGVRHTSLGRVIVDSKGRTLYLFEKDTSRRSACSGQCVQFWPPLLTPARP